MKVVECISSIKILALFSAKGPNRKGMVLNCEKEKQKTLGISGCNAWILVQKNGMYSKIAILDLYD